MKTILCFGDSNVWGSIPGGFDQKTGLSKRFKKDKRWTGVLQNELGYSYDVVTEGISARTTNLDEVTPGRPYKNGLLQLPICLESHYPIDLVIFWIGTNDAKIQYHRSPIQIAEGMRELIHTVVESNKGPLAKAPKILLVAPQPAISVTDMNPQVDNESIQKTCQLGFLYQKLAIDERCDFLDAGQYVSSSVIDGVHLDESEQIKLGKIVAEKIRDIFS